MSLLRATSVSLFMVVLHSATAAVLNPVVITETNGTCLSQEMRDAIIQNITALVRATITEANISNIFSCGPGTWDRVAYLNMSDPSQQCPSAWVAGNATGIRFCTQPYSYDFDCQGTSYTTGRQYSKVCGRAIGYQIGTTLAFWTRELIKPLIHTMSLESVWHTEYLATTSGHLLLVQISSSTVPAMAPTIQTVKSHHRLLEITTTVSQAIQRVLLLATKFTSMTHSGMVSSVRASAVVMENLLHGSVWTSFTQLMIILRCAFVVQGAHTTLNIALASNCWSYMSSENGKNLRLCDITYSTPYKLVKHKPYTVDTW